MHDMGGPIRGLVYKKQDIDVMPAEPVCENENINS